MLSPSESPPTLKTAEWLVEVDPSARSATFPTTVQRVTLPIVSYGPVSKLALPNGSVLGVGVGVAVGVPVGVGVAVGVAVGVGVGVGPPLKTIRATETLSTNVSELPFPVPTSAKRSV